MNPYLEQEGVWHKFHGQFCTHCLELLVPQVRPHYIVEFDENVYVHELPAEERRLLGRSDLSLVHNKAAVPYAAAGTALEAPTYARLSPSVDIERLSTIVIRDRQCRAIVTAIELLSPANKESDRQQYLRKRDEYISNGVCLVEIDLLRGGRRLPIDDAPPCDYYVMIAKPPDSPRVGLWPIQLSQRLPTIPIPLRPPHADAHLDLQEILHRLYDAGGYADYLFYRPAATSFARTGPMGAAVQRSIIVSNAPCTRAMIAIHRMRCGYVGTAVGIWSANLDQATHSNPRSRKRRNGRLSGPRSFAN
jgi:hypothetical protein